MQLKYDCNQQLVKIMAAAIQFTRISCYWQTPRDVLQHGKRASGCSLW